MKNLIRIAILLVSSLAWAGPTITAIAVTATTPTTATIIWTTGTPASSQVLYGIGNTGNSTPVDGTLLTSHSVTVALLSAGPIYTYAVVSQDSTGSTTSATNTFALCGGRSNTAVTGTVNTAYEYGLYTATLVNDSGSGATPTVCGSAVTSPVSGTLAWNGVLTQPLPDNNLIVPSPSHWSLTVTSMTGTGGPIGSFTITRVITGNSQDISATLQAGAAGQLQHVFYDPATLAFNPPISSGGGGTVTSITAGTGITATPNPIIGAGTIGITNTAVTPASYTNTNLTVNAQGQITAASNGSAGAGTVTTTGSPSSPNLAGFSAPTAITNVNLTGDVTTANTLATTVAQIQGLPVTLISPALGQTLSINATPAIVNGYPGIPVDTQAGTPYVVKGDGVGSDRASLLNTTNTSTSTAVTLPASGSTGFGSFFPFLHCNSGTVIATDSGTINGNANVVLQAKPTGGNPQCVGFYGNNSSWIAWETLPTDANGKLPFNSIAGVTGAQGNGTLLQFSTGTVTQNFLAKFDANGNTINSGLKEASFSVSSGTSTQGVTYGGGFGVSDGTTTGAITVGVATINGGNVISGTFPSVAGGSFLNGGSNAASSTASQAGVVEIMPGASTNATQGLQGLNIFGSPYVKGATVTQWNLECESAAMTVTDCGATPTNWIGVAESVGSNTVSVLTGSQAFVNASAAVTLGHTVCAGSTAGKVTDSGGVATCTNAQGPTFGVVMAVAGAWTLPDGTTVTATTTLPLVQMNTAMQAGAPLASPVFTGTPTAPTQTAGDSSADLATDAFVTTAVNNAVAGVNPAVAVQAATTQASDTSSYTYLNGVSGIGATLTGPTNNVAVIIDGFTFTAVGQRLLVKNDTQSPAGAFNGVYSLTILQGVTNKPVLTRALDYDTPSDMNNTGAIPVVNGTVNAQTQWVQTSQVATVGTDAVTFTQFTLNPTKIVTSVTGTVNQVTVTGTTTPVLTIPSTFIAPGSIQATTTICTGTCPVVCGTATGCSGATEGTAANMTPTANQDGCTWDTTAHAEKCTINNGPVFVSARNLTPTLLSCPELGNAICTSSVDASKNPNFLSGSGTTLTIGGGTTPLVMFIGGVPQTVNADLTVTIGTASTHQFVIAKQDTTNANMVAGDFVLSFADPVYSYTAPTCPTNPQGVAVSVTNPAFWFDLSMNLSKLCTSNGGSYAASPAISVGVIDVNATPAIDAALAEPYDLNPRHRFELFGDGSTASITVTSGTTTENGQAILQVPALEVTGGTLTYSGGTPGILVGLVVSSQNPVLVLNSVHISGDSAGNAGAGAGTGAGQSGVPGGMGGAGGGGGGSTSAGGSGSCRVKGLTLQCADGGSNGSSTGPTAGGPGYQATPGTSQVATTVTGGNLYMLGASFPGNGGPGANGSGDGTNSGGQGGTAGGTVIIKAPSIFVASTASITANGGNGNNGAGGNAAGGGGGGGGTVALLAGFLNTTGATLTATGGSVGTGLGTGKNGGLGGGGRVVQQKLW